MDNCVMFVIDLLESMKNVFNGLARDLPGDLESMSINPVVLEIFKKFHDFQVLLILKDRAPDRFAVEQVVLPGRLKAAHRINELNVEDREMIDLCDITKFVYEILNMLT